MILLKNTARFNMIEKTRKVIKSFISCTEQRSCGYSVKTAERIQNFGDSVWTEFTPLAIRTKSVNLGQGFPDWQIDSFVMDAFQKQANEKSHQYTRSAGDPILVNKIAEVYSSESMFNRSIDPMNEVLVTNGASGALYCTLLSLINSGDEVVIFEPFYDTYPANVTMAGGKPVYVSLKEKVHDGKSSQNWYLDEQDLRNVISKKTKVIILNNPHNPTGKVFTKSELEMIAKVAKENDLLVVSDEVYEFLVFGKDENTGSRLKHQRIASLDGMWERTLTLCSAGKTFSCTGWKIGYILGPKHLLHGAQLVNQYSIFCVNTPSQRAVAECLDKAVKTNYFEVIQQRLADRCSYLTSRLEENGLDVVKPDSGYFALANIKNIDFEKNFKEYDQNLQRDYNFCRWLPTSIGVVAIPPTAFMSKQHKYVVENYARFCFCKEESTLQEAGQRMKKLQEYMKK